MLHIHFDSRRDADPVFHMTEALCQAALARHPALAGRVRMTTGWNLEGMDQALQTADMLVGFRMRKDLVRDAAPKLKAIHLIGAGVEHLRPLDWLPGHIALTNNRGIHRQKAAEFITLAILMLNNRIPALATAQRHARWDQLFTTSVKGKTVLIVGVGELGGAGAAALRALGVRIIGIRRSGAPHPACDETYGPDRLHALLPEADFVLVATPLTAQTDGMMAAREFALMKPGAGFVNFGRARVCRYDDLVASLVSGHLSGAVLDVFDPEPLPSDSPLWATPNLFITPHCSSDDSESYIPATLDLVMENAARMLDGKPLRNVVDVTQEY